ncbi:hypothetical protein JOQ06_018340, partial [Pogonophryne albipinna]
MTPCAAQYYPSSWLHVVSESAWGPLMRCTLTQAAHNCPRDDLDPSWEGGGEQVDVVMSNGPSAVPSPPT